MIKKIASAALIFVLLFLGGCSIPFIKNGESTAKLDEPNEVASPELSPGINPPTDEPHVDGPKGELPPIN